ncbi:MAG: TolC family protein, partial [Erythrobacter sp.]
MIRTSLILAATLIAAGCTGADIPPVEPAAGIAIPVDFLADTRPEAGLDDVWWRGFDEPELNALVEAALLRNQSLEAARQRLVAARALVRAEQSDFAPTVDMLGTSDLDLNDAGSVLDGAGASIGGVWTIDINGRLSAELAAAVANADGAMHFVADRRRLIAAAVASQYIELKRTAARLQLLDQSTDLQRQTLNIVTLRFEAGLSANLDVRRAAADLARTQAQRGALV